MYSNNKFETKFKEITKLDFPKFYKEHKDPLIWHLSKWTKDLDLAEDLAEEAFIQALNKIEQYDNEKSKPHTWVYNIANNIVKKNFLDSQRLPLISMDKELGNDSNLALFLPYNDGKKEIETQEKLAQKTQIIRDAIVSMPEKQRKYRDVLIMRELENFTYDEIADCLKINLSTIKSQIKKGREIIVKKIDKKLKQIDIFGVSDDI